MLKATISIENSSGKVTVLSGMADIRTALSFCNKIIVSTPEGLYELWLDHGELHGKMININ